MEAQSLKDTISNLPSEPGIYKYFNQEDGLIYVGKAKNLKKRVSSYFSKSHTDNKTRSLVNQIIRLEFIVVNNERDALFLENTLIKEHQPKYNILLKDDKTYPYLVVTNERFPKIFATRKIIPGIGTYYGPYSNVKAMDSILELIKKLFTIRNCDLKLSEKSIQAGKFKRCLEYHLGNCKAPCEGLQSEDNYLQDIDQVKIILRGDLSILKWALKEEMKRFAIELKFEEAAKQKTKLEYLETFEERSLVTNIKYNNIAVFTLNVYKEKSFVNYFIISFGRITQSKTMEVVRKLDESDEEVLLTTIFRTLSELENKPDEVLTNIAIENNDTDYSLFTPQRGDKLSLIEMSLKNTHFYINNLNLREKKEPAAMRVMETLMKELNLKELPTHIECFDNSNLQGTTPVAAMSCFKNGVPSKKDYRHFNIKTVIGPNDFDSMKEIVFRRYSRLVSEGAELPKLIIIDGGKGQLSAAIESLKLAGVYGQIPIISIAKRLEEIYMPNDEFPLHLDKKSEGLKLIQRMRDEVHRFGITFHRNKRSKNALPPLPKKKK